MPTRTFLEALKELRLQATTTRMSQRKHMKAFVALVFEYTARARDCAATRQPGRANTSANLGGLKFCGVERKMRCLYSLLRKQEPSPAKAR